MSHPPPPHLPSWDRRVEENAKVLSWISLMASALTVVTFLLFRVKRRFPARLPLHMAIAAFGLSLSIVVGLHHTNFCAYEAFGIQFFGMACVMWWAIISFNFFRVAVHDGNPARKQLEIPFIILGWGMPLVVAIVSKSIGALDTHPHPGIWECWMTHLKGNDEWIFFYGEMGLTVLVGLALWPLICRRLWFVHHERPESLIKEYWRHMIFILLFFLVFTLMLAYRVVVDIHSGDIVAAGYYLTMTHTSCVCGVGLYVFVVFGLTSANLALWRSLLCGRSKMGDDSAPLLHSPYVSHYDGTPSSISRSSVHAQPIAPEETVTSSESPVVYVEQ